MSRRFYLSPTKSDFLRATLSQYPGRSIKSRTPPGCCINLCTYIVFRRYRIKQKNLGQNQREHTLVLPEVFLFYPIPPKYNIGAQVYTTARRSPGFYGTTRILG